MMSTCFRVDFRGVGPIDVFCSINSFFKIAPVAIVFCSARSFSFWHLSPDKKISQVLGTFVPYQTQELNLQITSQFLGIPSREQLEMKKGWIQQMPFAVYF